MLLTHYLTKMESLTIIILTIEPFWSSYKKPTIGVNNPFNSSYKSIDILIL